jgi:hypothetical protein
VTSPGWAASFVTGAAFLGPESEHDAQARSLSERYHPPPAPSGLCRSADFSRNEDLRSNTGESPA